MAVMDKCSLVLQFCTTVLVAAAVYLLIPDGTRIFSSDTGKVRITVDRFVSDLVGYDIVAPTLFLEIELAGTIRWTRDRDRHNQVREVIVNETFYFPDVKWMGAMFFRIRDASHSHKPSRGLLALTPSEASLNRFKVYKMDSMTWIVMKIEWGYLKGKTRPANLSLGSTQG